uniref:Uncharacterized protein n=1 Tax=Heterorhabditis bacteriophora TaxID=37862 RepID=A0A1I7XCN9_HETBA
MLKSYGNKLSLCYQYTDSLNYEIETRDIYEDVSNILTEDTGGNGEAAALRLKECFDFCDYPKDHSRYDQNNKQVIGKFQDGFNGNIMEEGVFKTKEKYAFNVDNEGKKKSKRIKKNDLKRKWEGWAIWVSQGFPGLG